MSVGFDRFTRLPFGKHRGKALADVDDSYFDWLANVADIQSEFLRDAIEHEWILRCAKAGRSWERPQQQDSRHERSYQVPTLRIPAGVTLSAAEEILAAGRRGVARQHHPDLGGDAAKMTEANATADFLAHLVAEMLGERRS
jgi:hypothetical protein